MSRQLGDLETSPEPIAQDFGQRRNLRRSSIPSFNKKYFTIDFLGEVAPRTLVDQMPTKERMLTLAKEFHGISFQHQCREKGNWVF